MAPTTHLRQRRHCHQLNLRRQRRCPHLALAWRCWSTSRCRPSRSLRRSQSSSNCGACVTAGMREYIFSVVVVLAGLSHFTCCFYFVRTLSVPLCALSTTAWPAPLRLSLIDQSSYGAPHMRIQCEQLYTNHVRRVCVFLESTLLITHFLRRCCCCCCSFLLFIVLCTLRCCCCFGQVVVAEPVAPGDEATIVCDLTAPTILGMLRLCNEFNAI